MKQIAQSNFDYLLIEIIKNRKKESISKEETKERIKQIGYAVGMRLTENVAQTEMLVKLDQVINFLLQTSTYSIFFSKYKITPSADNRKFTITVLESEFLQNVSAFSEGNELIEMKEFYICYLVGILYGTIEIRGFRINILQCL